MRTGSFALAIVLLPHLAFGTPRPRPSHPVSVNPARTTKAHFARTLTRRRHRIPNETASMATWTRRLVDVSVGRQ